MIEQDCGIDSFNKRSSNEKCNSVFTKNKPFLGDLNISDFINISLGHVSITPFEDKNIYGESFRSYKLANQREILDSINCSSNHDVVIFARSLTKYNSYYNQKGKKYLLWDDIKKVVELAGYLE